MKKQDKERKIEPFDTFDPFALSEAKPKPLSEEEIKEMFSSSVEKLEAALNSSSEQKEEIIEEKRDEIYDFLPDDFPYTNNKKNYKKKKTQSSKNEDVKSDTIGDKTTDEVVVAVKEENDDNKVKNKEIADKNEDFAWKFFISHKRFYIPLFFTLAIMIIAGYLTSPFQKNGKTALLIIDIFALVLSLAGSILLILAIRKAMKVEEYKTDELMFAIIFVYIFLIGFILTIFFRLWAKYNPSSYLNIGGLFSLFASVIALLACLFVALYPFKRYKR